MSSLWQVQAVDVNDNEIQLRVQAIHPDAGMFPTSKDFALRLLADKAFRFDTKGTYIVAAPLGAEIGPKGYWDEKFIQQNVNRFIASVSISDIENAPFNENAVRQSINGQLQDKGIDSQNDEAWQAANKDAWKEFWRTPSNLPSATYTIHVTDTRWITHLTKGVQWDTSAYG